MKNKILFIYMILIVLFFNYNIFNNEQHIKNGVTLYLEINSDDKLSFLQGHFIELKYKLYDDIVRERVKLNIEGKVIPSKAKVLIEVDEKGIGKFLSLQSDDFKENKNEIVMPIKFYQENPILPISDSYFINESKSNSFENAKYGFFKYANEKFLLVHLADENRNILSNH